MTVQQGDPLPLPLPTPVHAPQQHAAIPPTPALPPAAEFDLALYQQIRDMY